EDLDLVAAAHEADAVVAPALAAALGLLGRGELEVELHIAETLLGSHGAFGGEAAVIIGFRAGLDAVPGVEILAVEENNGVGRRPVGVAGRDDYRFGPDDAV